MINVTPCRRLPGWADDVCKTEFCRLLEHPHKAPPPPPLNARGIHLFGPQSCHCDAVSNSCFDELIIQFDPMQEAARLGPTMYMGEAALLGMEASKFNVKALTTVDLLMLQRSDAVRVLGAPFAQLASQTMGATSKKVRD